MSNIRCPRCGSELSEAQKFCAQCGLEVRFSLPSSPNGVGTWAIGLVAVVAFVLGAVAIFALMCGWVKDEKTENVAEPKGADAVQTVKEQALPAEREESMSLADVLSAWCNAHVEGGIDDLMQLYAERVKYYQSYYNRQQIRNSKEGMLRKNRQYTQTFRELKVTHVSNNVVVLNFLKHVAYKGKHDNYQSYLVLRKTSGEWRIVEEGDATTDKNLFKREKVFVRGLKRWCVSRSSNYVEFNYNSSGYRYTVTGYYNQVGMQFNVVDSNGNSEQLSFETLEEDNIASSEFLIGSYDFNYDEVDELVIAERSLNADYENVRLCVYGLKDYRWQLLTEMENVVMGDPLVDVVTNRVYSSRNLRYFYAERSLISGRFVDTSDL